MLTRLLLLFILVPAVELLLLIQLGRWIGTLPTVGLIVVTGIVGAYLTRQQGVQAIRRIQTDVNSGQMPGEALLDGAMILVAGAVLLTPGILTDIFGFLLLIPQSRKVINRFAWRQLEKRIQSGQIRVMGFGAMPSRPKEPGVVIIDGDDL